MTRIGVFAGNSPDFNTILCPLSLERKVTKPVASPVRGSLLIE